MKLKLGELSAKMLCQYTAVAAVVNQAFGDGSSAGSSDGVPQIGEYNDLAKGATFEQAIANINAGLRIG